MRATCTNSRQRCKFTAATPYPLHDWFFHSFARRCRLLRRGAVAVAAAKSLMVPIRSLGPDDAPAIASHLLALDPRDRYLRFGYLASDEQIQHYVKGLAFGRDEIFGIYNRKIDLIAMAHLAFSTDPDLKSCAEFGVSVLAKVRGRGYGTQLFDRALTSARNAGVAMLFIHALSENTTMLNISRKAGATVQRDGAESQAYLLLPTADLESRISEIFDEQVAQTDYRFKVQARRFWDFLGTLQEVRQGVRDARK